ncbi:hypothetical protein IL252_17110 [Halomicrobium sp. IBSBa]|uniref:hypothetical protein n=1 Tax=Halomicrobium sp. IBSBa TaxID=2778916 RepID=UPI001ABFE6E6|nr:hypothetical protein [Halomicrobium sp. IBSBa]MBO4249529.1 hypothetical protein [Halomicrobium sp. IBSBa]
MIGRILDLIGEKRIESVFLPMGIFSYIYASGNTAMCSFNPINSPFVYTGFSDHMYLVFAIISTITASIVYDSLRNYYNMETDDPAEALPDRLPATTIVLISFISFISLGLLSFSEVISRVCSKSPVLLGIFLISLIIITSALSSAFLTSS